ncbi:MAG: hypothetical protein ACYC26_11470 [Phycisphaerales bacterium]
MALRHPFLFVVVVSGLTAAGVCRAGNLAANGDFENGTTSWWFSNPGGAGWSVTDGIATLTRTSSGGWVRIYQDITGLTPGKTYRLIWKARVGAGGTGANAQPHYYWHLSDGSWPLYFPAGISTTSWGISDALVTMPANADKLRIGLRLDGENTSADCDGMYVGEDLLANGAFENDLSGWSPQATSPNSITVTGTSPDKEAKIHREDNGWMRLYQDVTVQSGHRYLLRGSVRSPSTAVPWVFYYYYDQTTGQWPNPITVPCVTATTPRIFQECIEIPPAYCTGGTGKIRIDLSSYTTANGDVYFSDVSLLDMGDHSGSLSIPAVSSEVTVDGALSDAFWTGGATTLQDTFRDTDFPGLQANQATTVKAGIANNMLYLSFDSAEPNITGMTARRTQDGWAMFDDRITVYVMYKSNPAEDMSPAKYVGFTVNSAGAKYATTSGQMTPDYNQAWYTHNLVIQPDEWSAAAKTDAANHKWTAEMAIPLTKLATYPSYINPDCLAINVARYRPQSETATTRWTMAAGGDDADISQFSRWALDWTPPGSAAPALAMTQPLTMPEYLLTGAPLDFAPGNELLNDGRFDNGPASWTVGTDADTLVKVNQGVVRIECGNASSTASLRQTCALPTYTYSGGGTWMPSYILRCRVWRNSGSGTVRVGYLWSGTGQSYHYFNIAANTSGQWQDVEWPITAPAIDTSGVTISLECTGAADTVARFTQVSLTMNLARSTFEGLAAPPSGWTVDLGSGVGSTITVNQGVLEIYRQDTNPLKNTRLFKDFHVKPDTWYTARAALKKSGGGTAQIYYYTSPDQLLWTYAGNLITSTSVNWETRQAIFKTGSTTKRIRLSIGPTNVNGTTAYVDDICLEESLPIPTAITFTQGTGVSIDNTASIGTQTLLLAGLCDSTGIASTHNITIDCSLWTTTPAAIGDRLTGDQLDLLNNRADAFYLGIGRAIDAGGNLVSSDKITVMSKTNDGILRGLARLAVLAGQARGKWPALLPAIDLIDAPRLDYRCVLLSASISASSGFTEPQSESDALYLLGFNATLFPVDGWGTPAAFPYASPTGVGGTTTTPSQWTSYADYNRNRGLQFVPSHFAWHSVAYLTSALPGSGYPYLQYAVNPSTLNTLLDPNSATWKNLNVWNTAGVNIAEGFMDELVATLNPKAVHIGHDETHYDYMIPPGDSDPTHTQVNYVRDGINIARDHLASLSGPVKTHLWGDMLDPNHNGKYLEYSGTPLLAQLPADIVIYDWKYDEAPYQSSTEVFVNAGFKTVGSSWYKPLSVSGNIRSVYECTLGGGAAPADTAEYGYCLTSWNSTSTNAVAPELVTSLALGAYLSWSADKNGLEYLPFPPGVLYHHAAVNYSGDDGKLYPYGHELPFAQSSTPLASPAGLTAESALVIALGMPSGTTLDCLTEPIITQRGVKIVPFASADRPAAIVSSASPSTLSFPADTHAAYITFLHTVNQQPDAGGMSSNNTAYNNISPGKYQLIFNEGTVDVELKFRDNITDWNSNDLPRHAELGLFGTAGNAYHVNIPTLTWRNPNPAWTLTGIKVYSGNRTAPTQVLINGQYVDVPAMNLYLLGVSLDH